jgi:hypothetical protein
MYALYNKILMRIRWIYTQIFCKSFSSSKRLASVLFQYENEIEDTDKECFELLGVWSAAEIT